MGPNTSAQALIEEARLDFSKQNRSRLKKDATPFPDSELYAIERIGSTSPVELGIIDAAENWVVEAQKDLGRPPNDNEWSRFVQSPLDGQIGMSYALQWRYNFGRLFNDSNL